MTERDPLPSPGAAGRPVHLPSLVAGVVVAVLWVAFAFGDLDSLRDQVRIVLPTVLLAAGVGLLASSRRR